jgi:hypothetical protein
MLGKQNLVAFAATKDGAAARKFYEGALGLEVEYEDDFAIAFDAHGTSLRIQTRPKDRRIVAVISGRRHGFLCVFRRLREGRRLAESA